MEATLNTDKLEDKNKKVQYVSVFLIEFAFLKKKKKKKKTIINIKQ